MTDHVRLSSLIAGLTLLVVSMAHGEQVNPLPRELLAGETLRTWAFDEGLDGWGRATQADVRADDGVLTITATGEDPNLESPALDVAGPIVLRLRARSTTAGSGEVFWTTDASQSYSPARGTRFPLRHDGQWHTYTVLIDTPETIHRLRVDPGSSPGTIEVDWVRTQRGRLHPLEISELHAGPEGIELRLRNHAAEPLACRVNGRDVTVPGPPPGETTVRLDVAGRHVFEDATVVVTAEGLPPLRRSVVVYRPDARSAQASWPVLQRGPLALRISPDGRGAEILREDELVAVLAPLVQVEGEIAPLDVVSSSTQTAHLRGDGIDVAIELGEQTVHVHIDSDQPCEGPVLRVMGALEQGLFAGLEYLGAGERSSSKLDIHTDEHLRYAPDPLKVTMPLMACVTDRAAAAMSWRDMTLQPVFTSPNFLDGSDDHRMALRGRRIEATLLVREPAPLEELILWAVEQRGLPPLPERPRAKAQQRALNLESLTQVVAGDGGWGHAAEPRWERRPYVDMVSTLWRLGQPVDPPQIVSGGSHLRNDAGYFLTGRAGEWLAVRRSEARALLAEQQADGSFRYEGPYMQGHFEDTASGYCAWRAVLLLEYARLTGDQDVLAGGLAALEFMKRFRTPRGAQTHELSLHTPDLLGSAYLVWAYVRGYELTGDPSYLAAARKWALSGVPFVYQWSDRPTMAYATIACYGATNWYEPNWIGLPVQWCGVTYAYALAMLAPHERTLDWPHLARGILITAERMQYPEGELAGCLPDFFLLPEQRRAGPSINPCAIVSLQRVLNGELDALAVAQGDGYRVVAPYPVTIEDGVARIEAEPGVTYQLLVNGHRVIDVTSQGVDRVPLSEAAGEKRRPSAERS